MSEMSSPSLSFGQRLKRAMINLLRALLVLLLLVGLGAAIYFGTPYLYEKFILPVGTNTARLAEVEARQAAAMGQFAAQVADLQVRVGDLESRQTASAQAGVELQGRVGALDQAVAEQSATLRQLDSLQATVDSLVASSEAHAGLLVGKESALAGLQHQLGVSRAIELLSRSRLYLSQSNFGLAKQDVQAARDLLSALLGETTPDQAAVLQEAVSRLDQALANLPGFPVVAVGDVDIAWQILILGMPTEAGGAPTTDTGSATPLPAGEPTTTP